MNSTESKYEGTAVDLRARQVVLLGKCEFQNVRCPAVPEEKSWTVRS